MDPPDAKKPGGSVIPLLLASCLALTAAGALLFLTLGLFGYVLASAAVVFAATALHYVVWGKWLSRRIHDEVAAEERAQRPLSTVDEPGPDDIPHARRDARQ